MKHKLVNDNPSMIISEQGFEMGRPSIIRIEIERMGSEITRDRGRTVRVHGRRIP